MTPHRSLFRVSAVALLRFTCSYAFQTVSLSTTNTCHTEKLQIDSNKKCSPTRNASASRVSTKLHDNVYNDFDSDDPFDELDDADGLGFITQNNAASEDTTLNYLSSLSQPTQPIKDAVPDPAGASPSSKLSKQNSPSTTDLSGATYRQFKFGYDITLSAFVGALGFDEVVDWEYYETSYDEEEGREVGDRKVVEPPPLDPTKPKRTRSSSGSVIRLFLGQFTGTLASSLRSKGMDARILVKEFAGDLAADLAKAELASISKLQTELIREHGNDEVREGKWSTTALNRIDSWGKQGGGGNTREDDASVIQLVELRQREKVPYVTILGNMVFEENVETTAVDRQEWYSTLGVSPPKPGSIWIVYEYAGLNHAGTYSQPAAIRKAEMPPKRGVFGLPMSTPALPSWQERANYVVNGILRKTLEAVAILHENGIAHRSIGRSSVILSSVGMDKTETSGMYATSIPRLVVKLADFGFSGPIASSSLDEGFRSRARGFGVEVKDGTSSMGSTGFAMAEDLHALGFVFLGLLLTALAEIPENSKEFRMPPTDEDRLQRVS